MSLANSGASLSSRSALCGASCSTISPFATCFAHWSDARTWRAFRRHWKNCRNSRSSCASSESPIPFSNGVTRRRAEYCDSTTSSAQMAIWVVSPIDLSAPQQRGLMGALATNLDSLPSWWYNRDTSSIDIIRLLIDKPPPWARHGVQDAAHHEGGKPVKRAVSVPILILILVVATSCAPQ